MKKWILAMMAIGCLMGGVACGKETGKTSDSNASTELPDVSVETLIEKNKVSEMLKGNETLLVTFTESDSRSNVVAQNIWYYNYDGGDLVVDYREKANGKDITEYGTFFEGAYYGRREGESFIQFTPETDFVQMASALTQLSFIGSDAADATLSASDNEILLKASTSDESGNDCIWMYRFDRESYILNTAMVLVYQTNGVFLKSEEYKYARNETVDWARTAYEDITNPEEGKTVDVTAQYMKQGELSHSRSFKITPTTNLYAKDVVSNVDYCVYANEACTEIISDLQYVAQEETVTIYIAEAKDGEVEIRDLKFAQRDNAIASIVDVYGTYWVYYQEFSAIDELKSQQYWYYSANRSELGDAEEETATFDFVECDESNKILKVVNFRKNGFYTLENDGTSEGRRSFAYVVDEDVESVVFAHGKQGLEKQKILTPMTRTGNIYVLVTTQTVVGENYKTTEWTYTFQNIDGKILLHNIRIDRYSSNGELVSYVQVRMAYGRTWEKRITDAYDRIAGTSAGKKIQGNIKLDAYTEQQRITPYALNENTYVSVYPSALGVGYTMYRHDLMSPITKVSVLGTDKTIYVMPTL